MSKIIIIFLIVSSIYHMSQGYTGDDLGRLLFGIAAIFLAIVMWAEE